MSIGDVTGFKQIRSSAERFWSAYEKTFSRGENLLPFGVEFLDRALGGISRSDIVLVGAPTGAGKTELVTNVAKNVAKIGKQVVFFALEAEQYEIETRIIYNEAAQLYFADTNRRAMDINYEAFATGKVSIDFSAYVEDAREKTKWLSNLHTFYRGSEKFGLERFEGFMHGLQGHADLIIIDHLNYFDLETENENAEYSRIVKAIRDMALITEIPVVLVAHLKKRDKASKYLLPDMDDFHGTSNIGKICTKAILVAPCYSESLTTVWKTYMRIGKNRMMGSRTKFVGITMFDIRSNSYLKEFELGHLSKDQTSFVPITHRPPWARVNEGDSHETLRSGRHPFKDA